MGRDTLRQLEDQLIRFEQAKRDGKMLLGLDTGIWLVQMMIKQQKEINELKEKQ